MKWLQIGLLAGLSAASILADVTYDESYGSAVEQYDIEPSPLTMPGVPPTVSIARFILPNLSIPQLRRNFRVYVKGNRMARVGSFISTIYDLDTGTVTLIDHEQSRYAVFGFAAMERHIEKSRGPTSGGKVEITGTGRTMDIQGETASEFAATLWNGQVRTVQRSPMQYIGRSPNCHRKNWPRFRNTAWTSMAASTPLSAP